MTLVSLTGGPDGPGKPRGPLGPGIPCKHRTVQMLECSMYGIFFINYESC